MSNLKAHGKYLILEESKSEYRGAIAVPETFASRTSSCIVASVGPKVTLPLKEGDIVFCSTNFGERKNLRVEGWNAFFCKESQIFAMERKGKVYPFGPRYLIRRIMGDEVSRGGIICPETWRYQSLDGIVAGIGILGRNKKSRWKMNGPKLGDKIRLKSWGEHMIEIGIMNEYYLLVDESDLLFKYTENNS